VVSGWRWARVAVVALYRFFVFHKNFEALKFCV
jgi:hypothetical protein